jgi:hypothetical protein
MIKEIELINRGTINKNEIKIVKENAAFSLFFSYNTLIGIEYGCWLKDVYVFKKAIIENLWSTTTGKFLNELQPDKTKRLQKEEFLKEVEKMFILLNT